MSLFSGETPVLGDAASVSGNKISKSHQIIVPLAAASTNATVFVAANDYRVVSVQEIHGVVGGSGASVNLEVIPSGTANGSGTATVLSAAIGLTSTANTTKTATLGAGTLIPAGSRLGTVLAGTLTGLANGVLQIGIVRA